MSSKSVGCIVPSSKPVTCFFVYRRTQGLEEGWQEQKFLSELPTHPRVPVTVNVPQEMLRLMDKTW